MALLDKNEIELDNLELWFANLVDALNFNIGAIQAELLILDPAWAEKLTTIDTSPVQDIKNAFNTIQSKLRTLEERIVKLGG